MVFIRKVKVGDKTYLAEVKSAREGDKVRQQFIRYVGREVSGKRIFSGSAEETEVTSVKVWAPLAVLDSLAKQINLSELLGEHGDYILSMVYAHCLDPKSVNKMEEWFSRTDLHKMLSINDVSEQKLYDALDSINEKNEGLIQKKIFESVTEKFKLRPAGYFFDVTNVYFYGTECCIAKKGHNKEGKHKPQVQIGLAVTKEDSIPILHKTYEGNIFDARTLQNFLVDFNYFSIGEITIVWDRGVTSEENIILAKKTGFEVICGLAIKQNVEKKVDEILDKKIDFIRIGERIKLKNTVLYCIKQKYGYRSIKGQLVLCFNEEQARINRETRFDKIIQAQELRKKKRPISEGIKKYLNQDNTINEKEVNKARKYDGYSVIFSTKDLPTTEIVKPYFSKDKVEKAFRSLKSVLGLRPIKHWLEKRVKSHIFICYISYLLLSLLEKKIKKTNITAIAAIDKLSTAYKVNLRNKKLKNEFEKIVTLTQEQEKIIRHVDKKILKIKCSD